jgi:hypothetical protein
MWDCSWGKFVFEEVEVACEYIGAHKSAESLLCPVKVGWQISSGSEYGEQWILSSRRVSQNEGRIMMVLILAYSSGVLFCIHKCPVLSSKRLRRKHRLLKQDESNRTQSHVVPRRCLERETFVRNSEVGRMGGWIWGLVTNRLGCMEVGMKTSQIYGLSFALDPFPPIIWPGLVTVCGIQCVT